MGPMELAEEVSFANDIKPDLDPYPNVLPAIFPDLTPVTL